jgi:hypothetical protein
MFCNECGTRAHEDAKFCGKCGHPLQAEASPKEAGKDHERHETGKGGMLSPKRQLLVGIVAVACIQAFFQWQLSPGAVDELVASAVGKTIGMIVVSLLFAQLIGLWKVARPYVVAIGMGLAALSSTMLGVSELDKHRDSARFMEEVQGASGVEDLTQRLQQSETKAGQFLAWMWARRKETLASLEVKFNELDDPLLTSVENEDTYQNPETAKRLFEVASRKAALARLLPVLIDSVFAAEKDAVQGHLKEKGSTLDLRKPEDIVAKYAKGADRIRKWFLEAARLRTEHLDAIGELAALVSIKQPNIDTKTSQLLFPTDEDVEHFTMLVGRVDQIAEELEAHSKAFTELVQESEARARQLGMEK